MSKRQGITNVRTVQRKKDPNDDMFDEEKCGKDFIIRRFQSFHDLSSANEGPAKNDQKFLQRNDIKLFMAPHPHDIDWNSFDDLHTNKSNIGHIIAWIVILLFIPVLTYFVEFKLSMRLALSMKGLVSENENVFIGNTFIFMAIRIALSVWFNAICTFLIDIYYMKKKFKTFSERNSSKFYFYNIYFMLSQIVADFYGVLSAGLISLSDVNDVSNLKRAYSTF